MKTSVPASAFTVLFLLLCITPVHATVSSAPEPFTRAPMELPRRHVVFFLNPISEEELLVIDSYLGPLRDRLPDESELKVLRRDAVVRLFLMYGVCFIGGGMGPTFEQAAKGLAESIVDRKFMEGGYSLNIRLRNCRPQ